jgi:hypothetical protein
MNYGGFYKMTEFLANIKDMWLQYYPVIIGGVSAVAGVLGGIYAVWLMVKPVIEKVSALKESISSKSQEVDPLKVIQASSLATDLKAKLASPTIPDNLKLEYQSQLYELEKVLSASNTTLDTIEDKLGNF